MMKSRSTLVPVTLAALTLSAGLMNSISAYALDGAVKATTKWTVGRVASVAQGSYCTMAQKFSDNTVVTIAKNARAEYSVAFDFAEPQFKTGEKLSVALTPQGGAKETFGLPAQSPKTVVVGMGKDAPFLSALKKDGAFNLGVGDKSQSFSLAGYDAGVADLETCLSGLKADPHGKTADIPSSDKVGVSSPKPEVQRTVLNMQADMNPKAPAEQPFQKEYPKVDISAEGLLAAKPTPTDGSAPMDAEFIPVPVERTGAVAMNAAAAVVDAPVARSVAQPVKEVRSVVEESDADSAVVDGLRTENESLRRTLDALKKNNALQSQQALAGTQEQIASLQKNLDLATAQNEMLNSKIKALESAKPRQDDLDALASLKKDLDASRGQLEKARADLKLAQTQNETLKADTAAKLAQASKDGSVQNAVQQSLAAVKAENETLRNQISLLEGQTKLAQTAQSTGASSAQLATLEQKNKDLLNQIEQLKLASTTMPAPAVAAAQQEPSAGEEKLRDEVRDLRLQIQTLSAERDNLNHRIESVQKETEHSQLKMAGGSWDLEQATRRYQESQREIRRLGALLDEQKMTCQKEKKDIEYMLFDPAIASSAQISMLNSLEDSVATKEAAIQKLQGDIQAAQNNPSPQFEQQLADLRATLSAREQELAASKSQIESLKQDMDNKVKAQSVSLDAQVRGKDQEISTLRQQVSELQKAQQDLKARQVSQPVPVREAQPAPVSGFQNAAYTAQPVTAFPDKQDVVELLSASGIKVSDSVRVVEGDDPAYRAFSWKTGGLFGSTEMRYVPNSAEYSDLISGYLDRAKSRCDGEFAAVPTKVASAGAEKSTGYEIACVGGDSATSASVLFRYAQDIVTTVAHEGNADLMDVAIDARDRVASHMN